MINRYILDFFTDFTCIQFKPPVIMPVFIKKINLRIRNNENNYCVNYSTQGLPVQMV